MNQAIAGSDRVQQQQDAWRTFQAKYGEKPKEQREIKKSLDKDDFLKIMITQMQHQDPTKPFDADKLAAEIAQITGVEQLKNVNLALKQLGDQNKPMERMAMTNLIGKTVSLNRNVFPHQKGENSPISFQLPAASGETKLVLVSKSGEVILEKDIGPMSQGQNTWVWDGKKQNTTAADSGDYLLRIEAKDAEGKSIDISTDRRAKIVGVSFEGQEPVFLVENGTGREKIKLSGIGVIEEPGISTSPVETKKPLALISQAATQPQVPQMQVKNTPPPVPVDHIKKVADQALAQAMASTPAARPAVQPHPEEKGFPNGLSFYDQKGGEQK